VTSDLGPSTPSTARWWNSTIRSTRSSPTGVARTVDDSLKSPFAVVTYFAPDQTIQVDQPLDCGQFESYLDGQLASLNIPYAIKVTGVFAELQTRSEPGQTQPYRPLAEVLKGQVTFDMSNVEGVMVGFRLPSYMAGANAAGYHFHFPYSQSNGRRTCSEVSGPAGYCRNRCDEQWDTDLPSNDAFYKINLSSAGAE